MEKSYYDILQVNKNASLEIIEKAYKVLAKKYHPDLQTEENKKQAEEILKEINEAYEILSNSEKREEYDSLLLENEKIKFSHFSENYSTNCSDNRTFSSEKVQKDDFFEKNEPNFSKKQQEETHKLSQEQMQRKQDLDHLAKLQQEKEEYQTRLQQEAIYQEQLNQARKKAYYDAYIQDLKNRGYRIRYKKTFKDYVRIFITFFAILLALFLLWQIPFIKNFFINLYEENEIIHYIVDLFSKIISRN